LVAGAIGALLLVAQPASAVPYAPGDVFAGIGNGKINQFSPTGTLKATLDTTSGSNEDTGMCFDAPGNLYSTNFEANNMTKFDNAGNILIHPFGTGFNQHPESCVANASGSIYTGQADGSADVLKFDAAGNSQGSFNPATGDRGTDWIELAADQCTIYYTSEDTTVHRFNVCTNTQLADFATGLPGSFCFALRIRSNGEVLVACDSGVVRLSSTGTVTQTYPAANYGSSYLFALNLDPDGQSFWTADIFTGLITRIDIATGNQVTQFSGQNQTTLAGLAVFGEPQVGGGGGGGGGAAKGRMTGGGTIVSTSVHHGFELPCDKTKSPNNLEVNWGKGNKFHLESLTSAACSDDPSISEGQPVAGFDTYRGSGTGRYNGTSGATAEWTMTDAGEPGTNDTFRIKIKDASNNVVLDVSGKIQGNQQAHPG
jgi:sugar lactone lactonase YvrE